MTMKRAATALAMTGLLLTACGGGSSRYNDAASIAKAADLSCKADPEEVGVSDAMSCGNDTEIMWFKSHEALTSIMGMTSSSPDTFVVGDNWAVECVHHADCVAIQKKLGGSLQ